MSESNGDWGGLVEHSDEAAQAWDGYDSIPEPGTYPALDAFLESKHLDHGALVRIGARMSNATTLAIAYHGGLKYRDVVSGRKWAWPDSTFGRLKVVPGTDRERVIVCEGETDAARLSMLYECDVAAMPAGATNWKPEFTRQVEGYKVVMVGLDNDPAGERGYSKIVEALPRAVRFRPPEGAGDWCDVDPSAVPLPDVVLAVEGPPSLLVPARQLLAMDNPELDSWFADAVLPVGGTALVHGTFKSLKTWITLSLAAALTQSIPWATFEPQEKPARIAYLNFEVPWAYYQQRVRLIHANAQHPDLFADNYFGYEPLTRPNLIAGNTDSEDRVLRALTEGGIQVVFLDPVRRAMGFADMNAENEVRRILHFAERLTREGITVVMTHHDNKEADKNGGGDPAGMTGSGAFAGDADSIISIQRAPGTQRESLRRNVHFLLRNAPAPPPKGFELTEDGKPLWRAETWVEDEEAEKKGVNIG